MNENNLYFLTFLGMMTLHPQSTGLQSVIDCITILKQILLLIQKETKGDATQEITLEAETLEMLKAVRGDNNLMKLDTTWKELQQHIDHVCNTVHNI